MKNWVLWILESIYLSIKFHFKLNFFINLSNPMKGKSLHCYMFTQKWTSSLFLIGYFLKKWPWNIFPAYNFFHSFTSFNVLKWIDNGTLAFLLVRQHLLFALRLHFISFFNKVVVIPFCTIHFIHSFTSFYLLFITHRSFLPFSIIITAALHTYILYCNSRVLKKKSNE